MAVMEPMAGGCAPGRVWSNRVWGGEKSSRDFLRSVLSATRVSEAAGREKHLRRLDHLLRTERQGAQARDAWKRRGTPERRTTFGSDGERFRQAAHARKRAAQASSGGVGGGDRRQTGQIARTGERSSSNRAP